MSTQIHATAHVPASAQIGDGTQIGANSSLAEGVIIGPNCQIGQNVSIGINVALANDVIVADGVVILGPAFIEDGVHLDEGARIGNVPPDKPFNHGVTHIKRGTQVQLKAVINQGVSVGPRAVVYQHAHVVENIKTGWFVLGNPAIFITLLDVEGATL